MKKVYVVDLTKEEKSELLKLVGKGEVRARKMNRAHILLLAEEDRTDKKTPRRYTPQPLHSRADAQALGRRRVGARPQRVAASRGQAQAYGQAGSVCGGFSLLPSSRGQEALEHADARRQTTSSSK